MKRYISFFVCLLLIVSMTTPLAAINQNAGDIENGEVSVARVEETQWYYRDNNGVLEKRLWSITYGYWKTDWIVL